MMMLKYSHLQKVPAGKSLEIINRTMPAVGCGGLTPPAINSVGKSAKS